MNDFGKIAYLDVQKTGCSFVSNFLNTCCTLPQIRFKKHDYVREDYKSDCFYFITIRNPYTMWSSLYRYGLDKRGGVYERLNQSGCTFCYESFNEFVAFCLDERNANLLDCDYNKEISQHIGFMSFRFLKLSLQFPIIQIKNCLAKNLNLRSLENKFITNLEVKNEFLIDGLKNFSLELFPQYFDPLKVQKFIDSTFRINESKTSETAIDRLSDNTLNRMQIKEWLLMCRY